MRRNEGRGKKNRLVANAGQLRGDSFGTTKKPDRTSVQSGPSSGCSFGGESIGDAAHAAADDGPVFTTLQLV